MTQHWHVSKYNPNYILKLFCAPVPAPSPAPTLSCFVYISLPGTTCLNPSFKQKLVCSPLYALSCCLHQFQIITQSLFLARKLSDTVTYFCHPPKSTNIPYCCKSRGTSYRLEHWMFSYLHANHTQWLEGHLRIHQFPFFTHASCGSVGQQTDFFSFFSSFFSSSFPPPTFCFS